MVKEWSTVEDAAPVLGLSKQGMYDAIRKGQLPREAVLRIGKRIRINMNALKSPSKHSEENKDARDSA
jgi:excisionase family DNA binding protein